MTEQEQRLSPDGSHWWDGEAWRLTSPDRRHWWDGAYWQPVAGAALAPGVQAPIAPVAPARQASGPPARPSRGLRFPGEENTKRRAIRRYFARTPDPKAPAVLLVLGAILTIPFSREFAIVGVPLMLVGGAWLAVQAARHFGRPEERIVDAWFGEDMDRLRDRAIERLNLQGYPDPANELWIVAPIWWQDEVYGVPQNEVLYRKGRDRLVRFSINSVTIFLLLEHKLSSFQCDYNFLRGVALNERDEEYYYQDIQSVASREVSTSYTLPNGQKMTRAHIFSVSVSSAESIRVVVNSPQIRELTRGESLDTGAEQAIRAIRKKLEERKVR